MKIKYLAVLTVGILVVGAGLICASPSRFNFFAKEESTEVEIEKDGSGEESQKRPKRTKFAINSVDSISANQMLLMTKKTKIADK